ASRLFDSLIVAVYDRPQKNLMFSTAERLAMAEEAMRGIPNLSVACYDTLTVDFARKHGASVIVRGLRVISDFELEYQMAHMTRALDGDIDMICLMTAVEHAFLSSTIIKEIALAGGPLSQFVPPHVDEALKTRAAARRH
ncbi:MAG: pantetheine-phosphate adenylyltransferase, partial [Anaerolineae bacterium]|nr:pantetheine-phosphate adenylyltransferase [Anaerolineae bacterium]